MPEQRDESYLFKSLEETYSQQRRTFEATRAAETNQRFFDRLRKIINNSRSRSSDNVNIQQTGSVTKYSATITRADFEYGGLANPGESVVSMSSDWFPYGQRTIDGSQVDLSVNFQSIDFIGFGGEQHQRRLGPVRIIP